MKLLRKAIDSPLNWALYWNEGGQWLTLSVLCHPGACVGFRLWLGYPLPFDTEVSFFWRGKPWTR